MLTNFELPVVGLGLEPHPLARKWVARDILRVTVGATESFPCSITGDHLASDKVLDHDVVRRSKGFSRTLIVQVVEVRLHRAVVLRRFPNETLFDCELLAVHLLQRGDGQDLEAIRGDHLFESCLPPPRTTARTAPRWSGAGTTCERIEALPKVVRHVAEPSLKLGEPIRASHPVGDAEDQVLHVAELPEPEVRSISDLGELVPEVAVVSVGKRVNGEDVDPSSRLREPPSAHLPVESPGILPVTHRVGNCVTDEDDEFRRLRVPAPSTELVQRLLVALVTVTTVRVRNGHDEVTKGVRARRQTDLLHHVAGLGIIADGDSPDLDLVEGSVEPVDEGAVGVTHFITHSGHRSREIEHDRSLNLSAHRIGFLA